MKSKSLSTETLRAPNSVYTHTMYRTYLLYSEKTENAIKEIFGTNGSIQVVSTPNV